MSNKIFENYYYWYQIIRFFQWVGVWDLPSNWDLSAHNFIHAFIIKRVYFIYIYGTLGAHIF